MQIIELNSNNNKIVANLYEPKTYNGRILIMSSATGAKQTYFKHFALHLNEHGFRVFTYDYSGIGQSAPKSLRGYTTSMADWGRYDLTTMIDYVSENYAYKKLLVSGQSVGGQIHGISPSIHKVDGLINVAAQSGYWKMWKMPFGVIGLFYWYGMIAITQIFGYFPGKRMNIVNDLPKGVALDWAKWGRSPGYNFDHIENAIEKYNAIKVPLLSYSFSDDKTAPLNTVEWMNAKYANCQLTHKHISPSDIGVEFIGHFGFFRADCKVLWDDLIQEVLKW
jgi:predicted alpha/beta hydrolase